MKIIKKGLEKKNIANWRELRGMAVEYCGMDYLIIDPFPATGGSELYPVVAIKPVYGEIVSVTSFFYQKGMSLWSAEIVNDDGSALTFEQSYFKFFYNHD